MGDGMELWALVPVKPFGEGKSRLAPLLSTEERAALSRSLFERTLAVLQDAGCFAGVIVVSSDSAVLALAAHMGAVSLHEEEAGLNRALEQARREAIVRGAGAVLVLPADVPGAEAQELCAIAAMAGGEDCIVIVPSDTGGTNLLLIRPPHVLDFAYGAESFERHVRLAEQAGLRIHVVRSSTLAFDVDLPADLDHVLVEPFRSQPQSAYDGPGIEVLI